MGIMLLISGMAAAQDTKPDFANLQKYSAANKSVNKKPKVVFMGDSITEGWVRADATFFESNNFVGRGISGQTSPQNLLRFRQDVIDLKPEMVVINIGTNDVAENTNEYSEKYTLDNYRNMIEIAKANDIKVILASVLPANSFPWRKNITNVAEKVLSLNEGIKALAKEYGVSYLDYHTPLKNQENGLDAELAKDGIHPTLEGYKKMEALALAAITQANKK